MQRIANVSHHKWGAEKRQVFTDVYSRTCAAKNHARVKNDAKRDTLETCNEIIG